MRFPAASPLAAAKLRPHFEDIMDDQIDRLRAALADRYDLDGELGAGGMATAPSSSWMA